MNGLLDQSDVNGCVLYNFNYVNEPLAHRQFLLPLDNALLEPHLRSRKTNIALQRNWKGCITEEFAIEVPLPRKHTDALPKRLRCHYRKTKNDDKTSKACIVYMVPICSEHHVCINCFTNY